VGNTLVEGVGAAAGRAADHSHAVARVLAPLHRRGSGGNGARVARPWPRGVTDDGRRAVLELFRWVDGHADVWAVLASPRALAAVVAGLAAAWADAGVTHVAGLEARGFAVVAPTAVALGAGFLRSARAVTSRDRCCPPPRLPTTAAAVTSCGCRPSWGPGTGCCWSTTGPSGSQAEAAAEPVRRQGAELLGLALVVDELPDTVRTRLGRGGPVQRLAPSLRGVRRTGSSFSGGCAGWPGARRP
jgi:adenine phosphoribosyltransferase